MTVTWAIELDGDPAERVRAELLVAPFFQGERPLRGAAGRIDWRLGGLLSAMLARDAFDGAPEEAVLVPTSPCLRAPRALLVGVGPRADFVPKTLRAAARRAIERAAALGAGHVALVLPAESEGGLPAERAAAAAVIGAGEALEERPFALRLRLVVEPAAAGRARLALAELVARIEMQGVAVRLASPDPAAAPAGDEDPSLPRHDPRIRPPPAAKLPSLP